MLEAARQDGLVLRHASSELQDDREIVLEAIRKNASALQYASSALKRDKKIVLEAIRQNVSTLEFADPSLREDTTLARYALEAAEENPDIILKIHNTGLNIDGISDEVILAAQIRALQTLLDEGKDDVAAAHLRFIKLLWGDAQRIAGDPHEQLGLSAIPQVHTAYHPPRSANGYFS